MATETKWACLFSNLKGEVHWTNKQNGDWVIGHLGYGDKKETAVRVAYDYCKERHEFCKMDACWQEEFKSKKHFRYWVWWNDRIERV